MEHCITLYMCERTQCDKKRNILKYLTVKPGIPEAVVFFLLDRCNLEMGLTSSVFFFFCLTGACLCIYVVLLENS